MPLGPLAFFSIIALLAAVLHLYLWGRLVRGTTRPGVWRRVGTAALVVLGVVGTVTFMVTRTIGVDARWLSWPGYVWIALLFYLLLVLAVLEVPRLVLTVGRWLRARRPGTGTDTDTARVAAREHSPALAPDTSSDGGGREPSSAEGEARAPEGGSGTARLDRRMLLSRTFAATAGVAAVGMVGSGIHTAFDDVRLVRVSIPVRGLDPTMSGFRIALVADTHFGPFMRKGTAERIRAQVNRSQPDMVAMVGDLSDGSVEATGHVVEPLRHLESPHGTYFVTGNHDYSSGAEEWIARVRELGMTPLLNERTEITVGGAAFDLAGVNDLAAEMYDAEGPDFSAALGDRDPDRPVVLLAHQPVQAFSAMEHGVNLQLSGHTHGGQTVPFDQITGLQQPVVAGLDHMGDTSVFVTRGTGFFGPPVRTGIPPEIAVVELTAPE